MQISIQGAVMKAILGFGFFLLFLAGIAFVMLQSRQLAQNNLPAGGSSLTGVDWRPIYIGAEPIPDDALMVVQFFVDGSIKGHGGCNAFSGSLEKAESGIKVGPLNATRQACPEPIMRRETALMNALQDTRHFELGNQRLQLTDRDKNLLAEFMRED